MINEKDVINAEFCISDKQIHKCIEEAGIYDFDINEIEREDSHLEHMISRIEEFRTKKEISRYKEIENKIGKEDQEIIYDHDNDDITSYVIESSRMHYEQENKTYGIKLVNSSDLPPNTGQILAYTFNATVYYQHIKDGEGENGVNNHLRNHIIIAHEAGGHLLLHVPTRIDNAKPKPIIYEYQETQATRCAEMILQNISKKYIEAGSLINYLIKNPTELRKAIMDVMNSGPKKYRYNPEQHIIDYKGVVYKDII